MKKPTEPASPSEVTLTPAEKKRIESVREKLVTAIAARDEQEATETKLRTKLESLDAEITELEAKVDPLDDAQVLLLTSKKNQRELVRRKLDAQPDVDSKDAKELAEYLDLTVVPLVSSNCEQFIQDLQRRIAAVVRPFCESESQARDVATFTAALQHSQIVARCPWRGMIASDAVGAARMAITSLDALILNDPFQFKNGE
jgi:hypothetical protein